MPLHAQNVEDTSGFAPHVVDLPLGAARSGHVHVLLTTEGPYPHERGGVSTWCHVLMQHMAEVDFTLWAAATTPEAAAQYRLTPNVVRLAGAFMPEDGALPEGRPARLDRFLALLERLLIQTGSAQTGLAQAGAPDLDPLGFAEALRDMHRHLAAEGFAVPFWTRATWDAVREMIGPPAPEPEPARSDRLGIRPAWSGPADEAVEGMRWLCRLLVPLNGPVIDADIAHSSDAAFCAVPAILAKLERGTPFVLTEHSAFMREQYRAIGRHNHPYHLKKLVVQLVSAVSRACYALADQVSPMCQYDARWEVRNGVPPRRIRVIRNGVDPAMFAPREGGPGSGVDMGAARRPTVVSLARVDPLKDLETFLRVAAEVRAAVPGVRFVHHGSVVDPDYHRRLLQLHQTLGLEETVEMRGPTDDPAGAINEGDVTLATSISEAFPYAVVKSLMCGRPVVATDVGGVREAMEGLGVLARPWDVTALADGVVRLLTLHPVARRELSELCRARALNLFTLDAAVEAYRQSYRRLAQRRGSSVQPTPIVGPSEPPVNAEVTSAAAVEPSTSVPARLPSLQAEPASALIPVSATPPAPTRRDRGADLSDVRAALADSDPVVRRRAVDRLAGMEGVPDALALLSQVLKDPSPSVRMAALNAIARVLER